MLKTSLIDLLVPADLDNEQPYRITPTTTGRASRVRDWLRGDAFLLSTYQGEAYMAVDPPEWETFRAPSTADIAAFIQWMPDDRGREVMQRWLEERQREEEEGDQS